MDFFTVPTLTFGVLYCFFVIAHGRRRILHCNVTKHPGSVWVIQQLREAFPYDSAPDYLIFDRGSNFNKEVIDTLKSFGTSFCIEALEEAIEKHGRPEIFNTDQGAQFTSEAFTRRLEEEGIQISMDGKGRWADNVFVERLWRSLKYEHVYLHAYVSVGEARMKIARYFEFYNSQRPHSSLGAQTPDQVYFHRPPQALAA